MTAGSVTAGSVTAGTVTVNDKDKGLTVSGPIKIDGKNVLAFGVGNNKNDGNSGTIGYQVHTSDALDIVGAGDGGQARKIKFWAEGGATLAGSLGRNFYL